MTTNTDSNGSFAAGLGISVMVALGVQLGGSILGL